MQFNPIFIFTRSLSDLSDASLRINGCFGGTAMIFSAPAIGVKTVELQKTTDLSVYQHFEEVLLQVKMKGQMTSNPQKTQTTTQRPTKESDNHVRELKRKRETKIM